MKPVPFGRRPQGRLPRETECWWVDRLFVRHDLERIFRFRGEALRQQLRRPIQGHGFFIWEH